MNPPEFGPTGSKITSCDISWENDVQTIHYLPPGPPEREVPTFDDEGELVGYSRLSDEEFARRTERYKLADAEHERTGGVHRAIGRRTWKCHVKCEDGSWGDAVGNGVNWFWTNWSGDVPVSQITSPPPQNPIR